MARCYPQDPEFTDKGGAEKAVFEALRDALPEDALLFHSVQLRDGSGERRWQGHGLRERPGGAACGALAHPTPASTGELTRSVCRSRAENTRGVGNCCLWRLGP